MSKNITHQIKNKEFKMDSLAARIKELTNEIEQKNQKLLEENRRLSDLLAQNQKETDNYYNILNKIYHSKTWKILGIYKKLSGTTKSMIKKVIPIATRKKIKSIIKARLFASATKSQIPQTILKEWRDWNYGPKKENSLDFINFSVIAWDFRFQRPQQIAKHLGSAGHRVFYIKNEFLAFSNSKSNFAPIKAVKKSKNIYEITLSASRNLFIYNDTPSNKDIQIISASIRTLIKEAQIANPIAKVDHPFWSQVLKQLEMPIVYDCMDNHQGFADNHSNIIKLEKELFRASKITVATSKYLKTLAEKNKAHNITLIPNAGDYNHFSASSNQTLLIPDDIKDIPHPIIGYYGAIAEWFDTKILETIASQNPDKSIVLIGGVTNNEVQHLASNYKNIFLLGEKPYLELPGYLKEFDVCIIPFILNDLIKATHPVKIYEYYAAGKPVVATKMPEIIEFKDDIFFATHNNFSQQIDLALKSKNPTRRQLIAKNNTWNKRASTLITTIEKNMFPKVSLILLSYNHAEMVKNTIDSILTRSFYPNFELIIVDNCSDQKTINTLKKYQHLSRVKVIFNKENYGFAKGNNIGLKQARGEYIVLINNDILVTPGWINRLLNHYKKGVGLVGPVTNNIGNEAKIDIEYNHFEIKDLEKKSFNYTSANWGKTLELNNIAAFCWIMSREVYKNIGKLDERFGRGMFEDDDYCLRVKNYGYKILCAEDAFVHHFGGASFKQLQSDEYQKIFNENKEKFEKKWNTKWVPHKYRKYENSKKK
jgi:GT2 family glycosyltransferase/glycosyltransferase involved in cell wall biosynthesis